MATLFFEFHGSDSGVREQAETVQQIAAGNGGHRLEWTTHPEDRKKLAERINARVVERPLAMGGTCTGEHGIGMHKKDFLRGLPADRARRRCAGRHAHH